jgi:hypothetical protein
MSADERNCKHSFKVKSIVGNCVLDGIAEESAFWNSTTQLLLEIISSLNRDELGNCHVRCNMLMIERNASKGES